MSHEHRNGSFRYSLRTAGVLVALASLSCFFLSRNDPLWTIALLNLTFAGLLVTVVGGLFLKGVVRAWCVGFTIGCISYLMLLRINGGSLLLSTILILKLSQGLGRVDGEAPIQWGGHFHRPFEFSSHLCFAVIVAVVTAYVARYLQMRSNNA